MYKIISVGGSIIIPKTGFNIPFLKQFRELILRKVKKGKKFILVIGGGSTCRIYQEAARQVVNLTDEDLDWIGIHTTRFNAEFVQSLFKGYTHEEIITDPTKKVITDKPIIIASGWKPGRSTDHVAVMLAKLYGAIEVMNLSNIEYVYDKDPNQFVDAKKILSLTWKDFRKNIVGNVWSAGKNAPFDPVASREAEKLGLTVSIIQGTDLVEVKKALQGKKYTGTIIHP